jgi:hypothetical protein
MFLSILFADLVIKLLQGMRQQIWHNTSLLKSIWNKGAGGEADEVDEAEEIASLPLTSLEDLNDLNKTLTTSKTLKKKMVSFRKK